MAHPRVHGLEGLLDEDTLASVRGVIAGICAQRSGVKPDLDKSAYLLPSHPVSQDILLNETSVALTGQGRTP